MDRIDELVAKAQVYGYRVDLGQFDRKEKAALDRAAKRGEVIKARLLWPYMHSGFSQKTYYINAGPEAA